MRGERTIALAVVAFVALAFVAVAFRHPLAGFALATVAVILALYFGAR